MTDENLLNYLSKPWRNFLTKLALYRDLKPSQWSEYQILGYLLSRFELVYNQKFALSYRGAPSKCPEMFMVKKLYPTLNSTDPRLIKEYIDWCYDTKLIPKRMNIRTLGYFTTPGLANEFLLNKKTAETITKSTPLPTVFLQAAETLAIPVSTYGDLAFIKMAVDQNPDSPARAPHKNLLKSLMALGLKEELLNSLK